MRNRISDRTRMARKLGVGQGLSYKSFINPRDFSADSRVHRIMGQIIARLYVLLSDLERSFFFYFDFCFGGNDDVVTDIKEQYPCLPLTQTQSIAAECQIKHPHNKKGEDVIMTTDMILTIQRHDREETVAVSVKPSSKLNKRTIEKMQIEKRYWNDHDVKWVLLTERQINKIQNNNIVFLRDFFKKESIESDHSPQILSELQARIHATDLSIDAFISDVSRKLKITEGVGRKCFYHLLATKQVRFDYTKSFNFNLMVNELTLTQYETIHQPSLS